LKQIGAIFCGAQENVGPLRSRRVGSCCIASVPGLPLPYLRLLGQLVLELGGMTDLLWRSARPTLD